MQKFETLSEKKYRTERWGQQNGLRESFDPIVCNTDIVFDVEIFFVGKQ